MNAITQQKDSIILENDRARISLGTKDACVESVTDKKTGREICKEKTAFFGLATREEALSARISLEGGVITVSTSLGNFRVRAEVFDDYFTFEILDELPKGAHLARVAHVKYDYDLSSGGVGACALAMSVRMNPCFFPDAKIRETKGEAVAHLGTAGAKLGLVIAPIDEHREILKTVTRAIDKRVGIASATGGAFSRDSRKNFSNYTIQHESSSAFIRNNIDFFKSLGVEQIDLHKGAGTFRQGDFKFMRYENGAEFKKNVSDVLEENGMSTGLHTYSFYIAYDCDPILSLPENQKQLKVMARFTLAEDITADAELLSTVESTDGISMDRGFCRTNSPYVLIGEELIRFEKATGGMRLSARGCAGTKAAPHKKGEEIAHIEGHYHGLVPIFGSPLFYEIARRTAKAYNEGGFRMIYLDALDGIHRHCERGVEDWFYMAAFVHELLSHCDTDPVLEAATFGPSMYAARGRIGAWDTPYRGYKRWNERHAAANRDYIDRHNVPILGWYNHYPITESYPGGEHTKYHHTDEIAHLGALAVKYDFPNVFNGVGRASLTRYAALARNVSLYKKYDELRRAEYFSPAYREKLCETPYEVALFEKRGKKFSFVEKHYEKKKLTDLRDPLRAKARFRNPFGKQIPFIRIEALLSTHKDDAFVLLPLDEEKPLISQPLVCNYGCEVNLSDRIAKVVRVHGNGKGGKIAIKTRCASNSEYGFGEYIIDVDFVGMREFILVESDNGERSDHRFEEKEGLYAIYRSSLNHDRTTKTEIETEGDMTDVRMSSVLACPHTYEVLKNPTVRIGEGEILFECELMSSDFIEFDGKEAKVIDRYGNEKPIFFTSTLTAPRGHFDVSLSARALNRTTPRAILTLGFTGKEIK